MGQFAAVPNDLSQRFRHRAGDCRALAETVQSPLDASLLEDIAAELEGAACWIDACGLPELAWPQASAPSKHN